jgi:hypothetical protein
VKGSVKAEVDDSAKQKQENNASSTNNNGGKNRGFFKGRGGANTWSSNQQNQRINQASGFIPAYAGPPTQSNICRRYNDKVCERHHTNCTLNTKMGLLRLYHVCNFMEKKNGKFELCKGYHPRMDHK